MSMMYGNLYNPEDAALQQPHETNAGIHPQTPFTPGNQATAPWNNQTQTSLDSSGNVGFGLQQPSSHPAATLIDGTIVKVFGLPPWSNQIDLYAFFCNLNFRANGVQLRILPDGRPSGEAYVAFETLEDAARACGMNNSPLNPQLYPNVMIRVAPLQISEADNAAAFLCVMGLPQLASSGAPPPGGPHSLLPPPQPLPHTPGLPPGTVVPPLPGSGVAVGGGGGGQGQQQHGAPHPGQAIASCIIKLKNLPFAARENDVAAFMAGFAIQDNGIDIIFYEKDKITGDAFVELSSAAEASRAVREKDKGVFGPAFGDRFVRVVQVPSTERAEAVSRSFKPGGQPGFDPFNDTYGFIKIKGLPFKATEKEIEDFFLGYGYNIVPNGVQLLLQPDGRMSGMAFAAFITQAEAQKATSKTRSVFNERHGDRFVTLIKVGREEVQETMAFGGKGVVTSMNAPKFQDPTQMMITEAMIESQQFAGKRRREFQ